MITMRTSKTKWLDRQAQDLLMSGLPLLQNKAYTATMRFRIQRDQTILLFLMNTGLKAREVCDLTLGEIIISSDKGYVIVRKGKGRRQREVPLNLTIRKVMDAWMKNRQAWLDARGLNADQLFISSGGTPLGRRRSLQRAVSRIGQHIGLELTPSILRHTFGKNLIDAGVSLEKVAALLGHNSLNSTRVYVTSDQQDLEKAVESLV